jgi:hypothetical protein
MSLVPPPAPVLYLATPCQGGRVSIFFLRSVLDLQRACADRGVGLHVELLPDEHVIARGRSRLAARFLAQAGATHLLFVDADVGFSPASVFRLLDADKDLCAAAYPLKSIDWEKVRAAARAGTADLAASGLGYVVRFLPTPGARIEVDEAGFAQVAYAGTGFLMIRRSALVRVAEAHPELVAVLDDGSTATMVFETMVEPETGEHLSEDYAFCRRWRDLGGEVWTDVTARLTHVGHAAYAGSLAQALKPA